MAGHLYKLLLIKQESMEGTVTVKDLKLEHLGKFINLFQFGTKDLMIPYLFREGIKLSFIVVCNLFYT